MAKRTKKAVYVMDREKAAEAFAEFAKQDAQLENVQSKMDLEITKIREKYQDKLDELNGEKAMAFDKLKAYAESNPEDFGKKKSIDFTHGVLGFRTGTPTVKAEKGHTWKSVLQLIKAFKPDYVRTKEEANKELILSDREKEGSLELFKKIGVKIEQKETFYVEPKKENVE
jgi:phage host-nuclease inhibitor protein Gam